MILIVFKMSFSFTILIKRHFDIALNFKILSFDMFTFLQKDIQFSNETPITMRTNVI